MAFLSCFLTNYIDAKNLSTIGFIPKSKIYFVIIIASINFLKILITSKWFLF